LTIGIGFAGERIQIEVLLSRAPWRWFLKTAAKVRGRKNRPRIPAEMDSRTARVSFVRRADRHEDAEEDG
jgi:hypothetical protein